jgi:hypothetical protein
VNLVAGGQPESSTNFTGFVYYLRGQPGDIPVLKRD